MIVSQQSAQVTMDLFADLPPAAEKTGQASYFNTTKAKGDELARYRSQAATQEEVIAEFFKQRPGRMFTPSELSALLPRAPLTSVRRAISDLTARGLLTKTDEKRPGVFNRPEHAWQLKEGNHVTNIP